MADFDTYSESEQRFDWWVFDHPPVGTCSRGCHFYGMCHCGCGETTRRSPVGSRDGGHRVRGEPSVFRSGHYGRVAPRGGGIWSKNGIPVERVRPLLAWLHRRHGSWDVVADLLRMPMATVKGYVNNTKRRRVPPEAARRITELVLAHRRRSSLLDQWQSEPGVRDRAPWSTS